ncbi:hypothetical protein JHK85_049247 [Glycine max]|uniref:Uncharacterized protein n=1 Tax=Glycine max TaxID=3847 RepID=A0A0R0FSH3_SOYBN|nr:hypothetical protein JHK85_049247 [Glycine max]
MVSSSSMVSTPSWLVSAFLRRRHALHPGILDPNSMKAFLSSSLLKRPSPLLSAFLNISLI